MVKNREKLLELLEKGPRTPTQMANALDISRQALHRHLKALTAKNQIQKIGTAPHVRYQRVVLNNESRIQESREFFEKQHLPTYIKATKIPRQYKKSSQIPSFEFILSAAAVYSSKIEGNSMNLNSFLNSQMQAKKFRPKEAQEIEDLIGAYQFSQNHVLNEKNIKKAHALLSPSFIRKARQGIYRQEPVGVFSNEGLIYLGIEPELVSSEMRHFTKQVRSLLNTPLNPVEALFWASWIHLTIALIHPFSDGNGRMARLCEKWFLIKKIGPEMIFLRSEEYYFRNKAAYYSSLRLGPNYWEVTFKNARPFFKLLPNSVNPNALN